jgi:Glycine/D-amino acid oxidases (deaminating)
MKTDFEYIVIGLGGLGSAAAYWLSRRAGKEVLGLEQYPLGHSNGESQDHSRIIRYSYHTPYYVKLAGEAYRAWSVLEEDSREKLIVRCGGLDLWPPNSIIPVPDYTESLKANQIPFELLNAAEIRKRFPQFQIGDDVTGLFQSDGGIAPAARCNVAHQKMAAAFRSTLLENTKVLSVDPVKMQVKTEDATYSCKQLVIAGGPWSNRLLKNFGTELPLTVTQEQVTYFNPSSLEEFSPERFPVWIWMDDPCYYGFPVYGEKAVKTGQDVGGKEVTAETRSFDPDPDALARVVNFMEKYLPEASKSILYTKTCLYTLTPDRDFVIDSIPEAPNCHIAIGAGHAFKFACVIGKILSELAIDGKTSSDLSHFQLTRPILKEKNPT